jgi:protein phosphatase
VLPQVDRWPLRENDVYLLCSDGVSNELPDKTLHRIVEANGPSEAAWKVINDALMAGGRDNATAIVLRVDGLRDA